MFDLLIPQKRTQREVAAEETRRVEFRPGRYTSGSANLDDMIECRKAVILCSAHTRKFDPKRARYAPHPDKALRRVIGNCDVCKAVGLSSLFLNEVDAEGELRKLEKYNRAREYGHIVTG